MGSRRRFFFPDKAERTRDGVRPLTQSTTDASHLPNVIRRKGGQPFSKSVPSLPTISDSEPSLHGQETWPPVPLPDPGNAMAPYYQHYDVTVDWDEESIDTSIWSPDVQQYTRMYYARYGAHTPGKTPWRLGRGLGPSGRRALSGRPHGQLPPIMASPRDSESTGGESGSEAFITEVAESGRTAWKGHTDTELWEHYSSDPIDQLDIDTLHAWVTAMRPRSIHDLKPMLILCQGLLKDIAAGHLDREMKKAEAMHAQLLVDMEAQQTSHEGVVAELEAQLKHLSQQLHGKDEDLQTLALLEKTRQWNAMAREAQLERKRRDVHEQMEAQIQRGKDLQKELEDTRAQLLTVQIEHKATQDMLASSTAEGEAAMSALEQARLELEEARAQLAALADSAVRQIRSRRSTRLSAEATDGAGPIPFPPGVEVPHSPILCSPTSSPRRTAEVSFAAVPSVLSEPCRTASAPRIVVKVPTHAGTPERRPVMVSVGTDPHMSMPDEPSSQVLHVEESPPSVPPPTAPQRAMQPSTSPSAAPPATAPPRAQSIKMVEQAAAKRASLTHVPEVLEVAATPTPEPEAPPEPEPEPSAERVDTVVALGGGSTTPRALQREPSGLASVASETEGDRLEKAIEQVEVSDTPAKLYEMSAELLHVMFAGLQGVLFVMEPRGGADGGGGGGGADEERLPSIDDLSVRLIDKGGGSRPSDEAIETARKLAWSTMLNGQLVEDDVHMAIPINGAAAQPLACLVVYHKSLKQTVPVMRMLSSKAAPARELARGLSMRPTFTEIGTDAPPKSAPKQGVTLAAGPSFAMREDSPAVPAAPVGPPPPEVVAAGTSPMSVSPALPQEPHVPVVFNVQAAPQVTAAVPEPAAPAIPDVIRAPEPPKPVAHSSDERRTKFKQAAKPPREPTVAMPADGVGPPLGHVAGDGVIEAPTHEPIGYCDDGGNLHVGADVPVVTKAVAGGPVRDPDGTVLGYVLNDGQVHSSKDGAIIGTVEAADGTLRAPDGVVVGQALPPSEVGSVVHEIVGEHRAIGFVLPDGGVAPLAAGPSADDERLGTVCEDGLVVDDGGEVVGQVSGEKVVKDTAGEAVGIADIVKNTITSLEDGTVAPLEEHTAVPDVRTPDDSAGQAALTQPPADSARDRIVMGRTCLGVAVADDGRVVGRIRPDAAVLAADGVLLGRMEDDGRIEVAAEAPQPAAPLTAVLPDHPSAPPLAPRGSPVPLPTARTPDRVTTLGYIRADGGVVNPSSGSLLGRLQPDGDVAPMSDGGAAETSTIGVVDLGGAAPGDIATRPGGAPLGILGADGRVRAERTAGQVEDARADGHGGERIRLTVVVGAVAPSGEVIRLDGMVLGRVVPGSAAAVEQPRPTPPAAEGGVRDLQIPLPLEGTTQETSAGGDNGLAVVYDPVSNPYARPPHDDVAIQADLLGLGPLGHHGASSEDEEEALLGSILQAANYIGAAAERVEVASGIAIERWDQVRSRFGKLLAHPSLSRSSSGVDKKLNDGWQEMQAQLNELAKARGKVLEQLQSAKTITAMQELRKYRRPPRAAVIVLMAVMVMLREQDAAVWEMDALKGIKFPTNAHLLGQLWMMLQQRLTHSVIKQMGQLDILALSSESIQQAVEATSFLLGQVTADTAQRASHVVGLMYNWVSVQINMHRHIRALQTGHPLPGTTLAGEPSAEFKDDRDIQAPSGGALW